MNTDTKNLVRRIQRQSLNRHDEVEPATAVRLEGDGFKFKGQTIKATRMATVQLCSLANLPMRTFEKLSAEQRAASFNELFERLGDRHFMFRFNADQIIGVVSTNYQKFGSDVLATTIKKASSSLNLVPFTAIVSPEFTFIRMIPEQAVEKLFFDN